MQISRIGRGSAVSTATLRAPQTVQVALKSWVETINSNEKNTPQILLVQNPAVLQEEIHFLRLPCYALLSRCLWLRPSLELPIIEPIKMRRVLTKPWCVFVFFSLPSKMWMTVHIIGLHYLNWLPVRSLIYNTFFPTTCVLFRSHAEIIIRFFCCWRASYTFSSRLRKLPQRAFWPGPE